MAVTRPSIAERRARFRQLHEAGCFLIPNPFDVGSARYLQSLGFAALASTSSGSAFTQGRPDGGMTLDDVLAHLRGLVEACDLPVNADFEDGHAANEDDLARNVARCIATGVAGLSIEDSTGNASQPLYPFAQSVSRMRAARAAIDASGQDVLLVGRAECFLTGHEQPLDEALRRLVAYAEAGADCLYAPGVRTRADIEAIVRAVDPKPVNVLVGWPSDFTLQELGDMGVRRVSVGGALAAAAWGGFITAAKSLADGRFDGFAGNAPTREIHAFFQADVAKRS
ncbi:MAG TPA: isocitrate lyase/phosphoenolpyruvate mutase family protein [Gemmatimonadaceae bacterium]|nr:isocitrate lyase/phosphoenolpyruvate mutase family protein [Gemmatimonadaceae bacterium]